MSPSRNPSNFSEKSEPSYGRRNFLKHSMVSIGVTVQEYVKHRDVVEKKEEKLEKKKTDWLRPPGALTEVQFLETCTNCRECVDVCPYGSIRLLEEDETPVIDPEETPCYLCDDFPCIAACEPEALRPVGAIQEIDMGVAVVSQRLCTSGQGCNACVAKCPTHAIEMDFSSMAIGVDGGRCVGCGICEHICKTVNDHVAIKVIPANLGALS